jgi:hypothetical protein
MSSPHKSKVKIIDPKSQANNPFQKSIIDSIWSWTTDIIFKKPKQKQKFQDKVKGPSKRNPGELHYFKFYEGEASPEEMYDYFRNLYKSIIASHKDEKYKECLKFLNEYQTESNCEMFFKFINLITEPQRDKIMTQDDVLIKLSVRYTLNREKKRHVDFINL